MLRRRRSDNLTHPLGGAFRRGSRYCAPSGRGTALAQLLFQEGAMRTRVFRMLVLLGSLMMAVTTSAQPPAAPSGLTVVVGDVVEGRVNRVDPHARTVTLDNGQEYLISPGLGVNWAGIRPGDAVQVHYNVEGSRKIATGLVLRP